MATFLTDMMEKGHTQDEVFAVLFESEREKKRKKMLAIVTKTMDAHRLEKMRELLAYEKLATFRRMNGFDQDVDRVYDWRSLPPTPKEFNTSLRYELQKLKDAISMPNEELARIKRLVEKRGREAAQVTVTPVDTVQHCSPCPPNQGGSTSLPTECVDTRELVPKVLQRLRISLHHRNTLVR